MSLHVDGEDAFLVRHGTLVFVRLASDEHVWWANTPDAELLAKDLEAKTLTHEDLEARGFSALR